MPLNCLACYLPVVAGEQDNPDGAAVIAKSLATTTTLRLRRLNRQGERPSCRHAYQHLWHAQLQLLENKLHLLLCCRDAVSLGKSFHSSLRPACSVEGIVGGDKNAEALWRQRRDGSSDELRSIARHADTAKRVGCLK